MSVFENLTVVKGLMNIIREVVSISNLFTTKVIRGMSEALGLKSLALSPF